MPPFLIPGGQLLLRHDQNAVPHHPADIHPEAVHHPGLQHQDPQPAREGQDLPLRGTRQLLPGWVSDGDIKHCRIRLNNPSRHAPPLLQNLRRHVMSYIITYYLPSGLFVVVSWISFLIPPDIVPGK